MSFYSADALPRAITDLEGVLCAGGVMTLFGRGTAARLAIVLGAPPQVVEVPDDDGSVPVPEDVEGSDDEPGPATDVRPDRRGRRAVGPAVDRPHSDDQRALIGPSAPPVALQVPDDHAGGWDEGVDEIPDDEFPTRADDGPPDDTAADDDRPDDGPHGTAPDHTAPHGTALDHTAPDGGPLDRTAPDGGPPATPPDGPSDRAKGASDRLDRPRGPLAQNGAPSRAAAGPPNPPTPGVVPPDPVVEWRAHALCCAFRGRGVPADVERLPDGRPVVRSAYRADLIQLATAWRGEHGATVVPPDLELDGPRLRLWVLAAGRRRGRAYTLGLDPHARATHEPLLTACQRAGLGATLAGDEDDPVVEIVGQRRQRRLAELVGDRPRSLAEGVWPE